MIILNLITCGNLINNNNNEFNKKTKKIKNSLRLFRQNIIVNFVRGSLISRKNNRHFLTFDLQ